MTPKSVVQVAFTEIEAIEVTCSECLGAVLIPLHTGNIPKHLACPGCNRQLWGDGQEKVYGRVLATAQALTLWKQLDHKAFTLGFSLPQSATHF